MRVVLCLDGPLKGLPHEIEYGWPIPSRFALPDLNETINERHWYKVDADQKTARYDNKSEPFVREKDYA